MSKNAENTTISADDIKALYANAESDKIIEIKRKVAEALSLDRQQLLLKQPFIGACLLRMELVPIRDARCRTACTDYKSIYFDISFYSELSPEERKFVLAHEIWHVIYMHSLRQQNRMSEYWNIAADCEINYMLKNEGFNPPKNLCFPDQAVQGKNAEEIYEHLLKKIKKLHNNSSNNSENIDSASNGQNSSSSDSTDKNGKLNGQFDKHIAENSELEEEFGKNGKTGIKDRFSNDAGDVGFDKDFRPSGSTKDASNKVREMITAAAQHCERSQGHMPNGIEKYLQELLTPEISWKEVLAQFVTRHIKSDRHWGPFNRRHLHRKIYMPGRSGESINVAVVVDTSGSCANDLPKFFSEMNSLVSQFEGSNMTIVQCDADIHSVVTYNEENQFDYDNIQITGFGGSSFIPVGEWFENGCQTDNYNEIETYDVCVVFTDGYIDFPKKPFPVPTLIILTNDGQENCCNWDCQKIKFKN